METVENNLVELKLPPQSQSVRIADLVPDPDNPNKMTAEKFDALVESMRRFGFLQPILVRRRKDGITYDIRDGHHRVKAAEAVGYDAVTMIEIGDLDPSEVVVASIGMNNLRGDPDLAEVGRRMAAAVDVGWTIPDLQITGFSEAEIAALVRSATAETDEAELPTAGLPAADEEPEGDEPEPRWSIEVEFADRETYRRARKAIRKFAGKGGSMADGLLALVEAAEG